MNKLLLLCLLTNMIIYTQCSIQCGNAVLTGDGDNKVESCTDASIEALPSYKKCVPNTGNTACVEQTLPCPSEFPASVSSPADKKTFCEGLSTAANKKCQLKGDNSACELVDKPATNSGSILNAFKITFALIIIFTIL